MQKRNSFNGFGFSRGNCEGFTLVEIAIAISVLFISMSAFICTQLSCSRLRQMNEEKALARNSADRVFSAIRGMPGLLDAYERFGGGGPEETFSIRGLRSPSSTEASGRVIVWRLKSSLQDTSTPPQPDPDSLLLLSLDEILAAQNFFASTFPNSLDSIAEVYGTSWDDFMDTNNDGLLTLIDDPKVLPVTVRVRWRTNSGMMTQYFSSVIGNR